MSVRQLVGERLPRHPTATPYRDNPPQKTIRLSKDGVTRLTKAIHRSAGVWWGESFTLNFELWRSQKLHIIILLHIGLVAFRFPKNQRICIFMIPGHSGNVHDPLETIILVFGYIKLLRIVKENHEQSLASRACLRFELWES